MGGMIRRVPRRAHVWWILGVAAVGLLIGAVVLLVMLAKPIEIAWNRQRVQQMLDQANDPLSSKDYSPDYEELNERLARLVKLESVVKRDYQCKHLLTSTDRWRHVWKRISARDCPPSLYVEANWSADPTPVVVTVWCDPDHEAEWEPFIASVDVP
jgi:hypothetical protein